jgi:uncharacterized coiled-coil protein SlyX/cell division septum initiation protein DivIVA
MSTPSVSREVIKPLLDPALAPGLHPNTRQTETKPLYDHLKEVEARLKNQEETIDSLNKQVQEIEPLQSQVRSLKGRVQSANEKLSAETQKTKEAEEKLRICIAVNGMPLQGVLERLGELGEPAGESLDAFEKGLLVERKKFMLEAQEAKGHELKEAAKKRCAEVSDKAAHIDDLMQILPEDFTQEKKLEYIEKAVKAIVDIQKPLKATYGTAQDWSHNGIGELLKKIILWKDEYKTKLDRVFTALGGDCAPLSIDVNSLLESINSLKNQANEASKILSKFDGVECWREELGQCLELLTETPFDQMEEVLGEQKYKLESVNKQLRDSTEGNREPLERKAKFLEEIVRLLELLKGNFVAKRKELEQKNAELDATKKELDLEKSTSRAIYRIALALWAVISYLPKELYDGFKNAHKFIPQSKKLFFIRDIFLKENVMKKK